MTPHTRALTKKRCLTAINLATDPYKLESWGLTQERRIDALQKSDRRTVWRAYSRKMAKLCHEEARGAV